MADPQKHLVRLLQMLEVLLRTGEQRSRAEFVSRLAETVASTADLEGTLGSLARVQEMERFAFRLMWSAERAREISDDTVEERIAEYEVGRLDRALDAATALAGREGVRQASVQTRDLGSTVNHFCASIAALRREAFNQERFVGARRATLQALALDAERLRAAASAERNEDVERFGRAFGGFLDYVLVQNLMMDVRVVNLIESASLTLQTATETLGADDYDALHQTTTLLEHPATLLDQRRAREEGA